MKSSFLHQARSQALNTGRLGSGRLSQGYMKPTSLRCAPINLAVSWPAPIGRRLTNSRPKAGFGLIIGGGFDDGGGGGMTHQCGSLT